MKEKFLLNKNILFLIALVLMLSPIIMSGRVIAVANDVKENCENEQCLAIPESNVSDNEFQSILDSLKGTSEYQSILNSTQVSKVSSDNVIINQDTSEDIYTVEFIMGQDLAKIDNLAYIKFTLNKESDKVLTTEKIYAESGDENSINLTMFVNDSHIFDMEINKDGKIVSDSGGLISNDDFYDEVVADLDSQVGPIMRGWCEWAMGALCGAACYAVAAALGITTGLGGLALATVCGLITALGCTAATKKVCG